MTAAEATPVTEQNPGWSQQEEPQTWAVGLPSRAWFVVHKIQNPVTIAEYDSPIKPQGHIIHSFQMPLMLVCAMLVLLTIKVKTQEFMNF